MTFTTDKNHNGVTGDKALYDMTIGVLKEHQATLPRPYDVHTFIAYSIHDIYEYMHDMEAFSTYAGDYPLLVRLTDDELDALLHRASYKGWTFWGVDDALDLSMLEELAEMYFRDEADAILAREAREHGNVIGYEGAACSGN